MAEADEQTQDKGECFHNEHHAHCSAYIPNSVLLFIPLPTSSHFATARSLWSWSGQCPTTQSPPFSISHLSPRSPFPARLTPSCRSPGRRSRLLVPRRRKVGHSDPKSLIHRRRKLNIGVMHLFAFIQHHLIFQGRRAVTAHKRRHQQGIKRPQLQSSQV